MSEPLRTPPRLVALEGPSGVGKTTLSRFLAERLDAMWLAEAYASLRPPPSLEFSSREELRALETRLALEEGRRYRAACDALRKGHWVVADTGFLGPLTYSLGLARLRGPGWDVTPELVGMLEGLLNRRAWGLPEIEIYLDIPATLQTRRAQSDPVSHPGRLRRRHREVGRVERELWLGTIPQLLPGLVRRVDGRGSVSIVDSRVERELRSRGRVPRFRSAAIRRFLRSTLPERTAVPPLGNR